PQAAVIAMQADVADELVDVVESRIVTVSRDDFEMRALPKSNRRLEVADNEGDGLAEVTIGRIADQSRAGVGVFGDDHGATSAPPETAVSDEKCFGSIMRRPGTPVRDSPPMTGTSPPREWRRRMR